MLFCPATVHFQFRNLVLLAVSLPLFGFLFAILWSILTAWESSTHTHCHVANILPSVSAALGNSLQENVWQWCVGLHVIPRCLMIWMYHKYLSQIIHQTLWLIVGLCGLLQSLENFGLLGLTFAGSDDNYEMHRNFFILFILCAEAYSIILVVLLQAYRKLPATPLEEKSLFVKRVLIICNVFSLLCAMYTFARHNSLCEPGVYSLFALFEYIVILTNMGFHMTAYWDFRHAIITTDHCQMRLKSHMYSCVDIV
ncbi:post-GPI attachment to proteins factor 2 isoform X2 [Folsomia candida]|uniref:post-GPI attachment to proteins factor 2 isoform X2 n=1 Tax=Folsomia candida TaxID=158441 RepID=UPI000B903702|nr:post-GPI attachment to proteins factor 2 isoform X2 [Folsomia candida]